ncbi:hypothetical protein ACF061_37800 [Streptomyces sp. NPDC015220]|uniref:hypothetical protein n=1 Tax=Streptomyces sp. NPDC015220 TaxID=3364947 RepID=UPI0036F961AA
MPFNINLTASKKPGQCKASVTGTVQHVINASEAKAFCLDQTDRIKTAIGKAIGRKPDEYWLKDPTPEGAANGERVRSTGTSTACSNGSRSPQRSLRRAHAWSGSPPSL